MRRTGFALVAGLLVTGLLAGCAQAGVARSEDATQERPMILTLAHSLSETHVTSIALNSFAEQVNELSDGRIQVRIYPNGQLGTETEVMEQLMAGVVDMTRVAAPTLATYHEGYHTFGLPYIFEDQEHYYAAMDSDGMREFFESSQSEGFVGLTYYTSGARSFYTIDRPIRVPADLAGLKIRVQDMSSQTDMMRALGGTPVVMGFGDIYTGLQTGIIDGAESNQTVLTVSRHGEVCKVFSLDEHTMIPDMLVIGSATWRRISPADQQLLIGAAEASTAQHKIDWDAEIAAAETQAQTQMGVEFIHDVDKAAFQEATAPVIDQYIDEYPMVGDVLQIINDAK